MEPNATSQPSPRASATVLMLRDAPTGLEVLLIKRHGLSDVLGGAYVFPGGKVDREDAALVDRLDEPVASLHDALGEPQLTAIEAATLYVAAIREAFEETGVLFADIDAETVRTIWDAASHEQRFVEALDAANVSLASRWLAPWSRWITPVASVMMTKRFDTRFFVAAVPPGQQPLHDEHEATESVWLSPKTALTRYWDREIQLAPPQIMTLAEMTRFGNVESVVANARRRKQPPCIQPEVVQDAGGRVVAFPGDPRHPVSSRVIPGPTHLRWCKDRFEPEEGLDALLR